MIIEDLYKIYQKYPRICTDSRQIIQNCLFFCLKGENFDGNNFAEKAFKEGARYVITENQKLRDRDEFIVVDNALTTLQQLAKYHREQLDIPVIGITGTNGKTTTKELISTVLSQKFRTAYTHGNLNNHIGVPLTLLSICPTDEIAVVEMGANHPGEIEFLCQFSQPTFGVITNIGKAHMEGFGSVEEIIHTKTALYRSVIQRNGTLFVNICDSILRKNLTYNHIIYYAEGGEKNILSMSPYLNIRAANYDIHTHLTGSYNIYNFLCAATIGHYFGVPDDQIASALANYKPSNNRSQINQVDSNTIIADYYNANPTSMEAAIRNLAKLEYPNKIAILGDMLELGNISKTEHLHIINLCKELGLKTLFVGPEFATHKPEYHFLDINELNTYLTQHPISNTLVLIKGSHGIHLDQLSKFIK